MRQAMTRSRHRFEPASAAICVAAVRSAVGTRVGMQPLRYMHSRKDYPLVGVQRLTGAPVVCHRFVPKPSNNVRFSSEASVTKHSN